MEPNNVSLHRWAWQHSLQIVDYTYWVDGAPSESSIEKDCLLMSAQDSFMWSDQSCEQALAAPLCQREAGGMTTPTPTETPTPSTTEAVPSNLSKLAIQKSDCLVVWWLALLLNILLSLSFSLDSPDSPLNLVNLV